MCVGKERLDLAALSSPTPWASTLGKRKKGGATLKKNISQTRADLPGPCQSLAGCSGGLGTGNSVPRLGRHLPACGRWQRRCHQVGGGGWQCPRGDITACAWGGGPGGVCLWAQVELRVPQCFLRERQAWNRRGQ